MPIIKYKIALFYQNITTFVDVLFQAIDADIGINNKVVYSVIDGKSSDPFTIDSSTGWIKSAQLFAGKIGSHFEVRILAQDNDGKKPNFNDSTLAKVRYFFCDFPKWMLDDRGKYRVA